jgi:hypothetical protein
MAVLSGTYALAAETSHKSHGMEMDNMGSGDTAKKDMFMHETVVDGVRAEFQVMSLANMNMKDEHGATHHIMVKLMAEDSGSPFADVVGKIKVIGMDKKEQIQSLKNYSGILAANFTFDAKGKYGVIGLFMVDGQKRLFRFWYPHS